MVAQRLRLRIVSPLFLNMVKNVTSKLRQISMTRPCWDVNWYSPDGAMRRSTEGVTAKGVVAGRQEMQLLVRGVLPGFSVSFFTLQAAWYQRISLLPVFRQPINQQALQVQNGKLRFAPSQLQVLGAGWFTASFSRMNKRIRSSDR